MQKNDPRRAISTAGLPERRANQAVVPAPDSLSCAAARTDHAAAAALARRATLRIERSVRQARVIFQTVPIGHACDVVGDDAVHALRGDALLEARWQASGSGDVFIKHRRQYATGVLVGVDEALAAVDVHEQETIELFKLEVERGRELDEWHTGVAGRLSHIGENTLLDAIDHRPQVSAPGLRRRGVWPLVGPAPHFHIAQRRDRQQVGVQTILQIVQRIRQPISQVNDEAFRRRRASVLQRMSTGFWSSISTASRLVCAWIA